MRKELEHFYIEESLGGNQDWFLDPFMKLGGCGAVTACDTCIWLARQSEVSDASWLYPFDLQNLCRRDFLHFGRIMKPYLRPRAGGINRLELYIRGFGAYLRGREELRNETAADTGSMDCPDSGPLLRMSGLEGTQPASAAWTALVQQIDKGFPVPMLLLRHKNPELKDFVWHWFLLAGYDDGSPGADCGERAANPDGLCRKVKAVTYGEAVWLDFDGLWDTGHEEKGGLVLYRWE